MKHCENCLFYHKWNHKNNDHGEGLCDKFDIILSGQKRPCKYFVKGKNIKKEKIYVKDYYL